MLPRRPVIIAHRGLHRDYPENSLEAMRAAWAGRVQWAECDVHESATGPLFVLHDDTLDRTTEYTGPVGGRIDAELDRCRLRDGHGGLTPYTLPRLGDVLGAMPPDGGLLIELKSVHDYAELVRDIAGRNIRVQSFDAEDLRRTAERDGQLPLSLLVGTPAELAAAVEMPYRSIHLDHALLDAAAHRQLARAGKSIGVWTINAEADLRRVVALGVEALITDEPALAEQVVEDLCGPG